MNDKSSVGIKIITINRKASFNFFFNEILEAGIVLKGSEIKSVRDGKVNIAESYACLLYTSPSPRDLSTYRMPSSA